MVIRKEQKEKLTELILKNTMLSATTPRSGFDLPLMLLSSHRT